MYTPCTLLYVGCISEEGGECARDFSYNVSVGYRLRSLKGPLAVRQMCKVREEGRVGKKI